MHRLVYLCDWLPPDFGAVGQYSQIFARERAEAGSHVTLVGLSSSGSSKETERRGAGVLETIRVEAPTYDKSRLLRRALWTLRTNLRLLWHSRSALRSADEILFTGSPPFLVHFVVPSNLVLRKRLTYRITDFHPECLIAELGKPTLLLKWFLGLTVALRRRVDRFEVLGEDQRAKLRALGIPAARIDLKRDPSPVHIPPTTKPLPLPPSLEGRVVLLYSGNFGVAHDHETFLEAYRLHHHEGTGRVVLWLNATGAKAALLERGLEERELPFHRGSPVPLEELPRLMVTPAAHLITLRDEFVGLVLPSKVYACVASGKPILFVGSATSDVDLVCRAARADRGYVRVDPGDSARAAEALEAIADLATESLES